MTLEIQVVSNVEKNCKNNFENLAKILEHLESLTF